MRNLKLAGILIAMFILFTGCFGMPYFYATSATTTTTDSGSRDSAPAAPAQPVRPASGTYTMWPRIQAYQNGIPINVFIYQVEISGSNMLVYIGDRVRGPADSQYLGGGFGSSSTITNLDNSSRTWKAVRDTRSEDYSIGSRILSFENFSGFRFSMEGSEKAVFEEFTFGEPDEPPPPGPPAGTYTFWPRIQAYQNGIPINVFVHQVVVRGKNVLMYLGDRETGPADSQYIGGGFGGSTVLTNLERPARSWKAIQETRSPDYSVGSRILSFENITGTYYSLDGSNGAMFEEIDLGLADYQP